MEKRHLRSLISSSPWFDSRSRNQFLQRQKMKLTDSRGPEIDTQKCVEQAGGNRFDLVLIATVRARELSRRHKAAGHTTQVNAPVSALLEIQEGKIGREYLKRVE